MQKKKKEADTDEQEIDLENQPEVCASFVSQFRHNKAESLSTCWCQVLKYELQETRKSQESFRDLYVRQRRENEDLKVLMKMHKRIPELQQR